MTRLTLLSWLLVLISMCHGAASHVEKRQASNMPQQTDSPQPTDSVQQTDLSQQTDLAGQTDTAGLAPQPTDMSQQLNIPQQQVDSMPQPDMMQLVPVPLDMAEPGHTNEPQLRTWEMFFWGPDREISPSLGNCYLESVLTTSSGRFCCQSHSHVRLRQSNGHQRG